MSKDKIFFNKQNIYSLLILFIVSSFQVIGVIVIIPSLKNNWFIWFVFIELLLVVSIILYYYLRYGTSKSRIKIEEKYYTMQIRRLNEQWSSGYIDKEQYDERIKEFEKKLKKQ